MENTASFEQMQFLKANVGRVTWIGLIINVVLSILKLIFGLIGHSQALVADAFHSLSDLATDFAVLLGVKYWAVPPDEAHPYGHKRIETMVTSMIGLALAGVGVGIGYEALSTIRDSHDAHPGWIAFIVAVISIVSKEILYHWTKKIGKRIKSSAVVANAWHHRTDALSSIPVAIAIVVAVIYPDLAYVDHLGALVVSVFIVYSAWEILKPTLFELSDASASKDVCEKIKELISSMDGIKSVHAIRTRRMGGGIYMDLHIMVDENLSVREGHEIARKARRKLLAEGPDINDVIIHIEPYEENH
ncbi:MAG: cation transporter [Lentisphaerae bacterium GWF2_44_16]|nr:MAG: cation transporter [Lentisphaerae bacterium GWF2_44_16]